MTEGSVTGWGTEALRGAQGAGQEGLLATFAVGALQAATCARPNGGQPRQVPRTPQPQAGGLQRAPLTRSAGGRRQRRPPRGRGSWGCSRTPGGASGFRRPGRGCPPAAPLALRPQPVHLRRLPADRSATLCLEVPGFITCRSITHNLVVTRHEGKARLRGAERSFTTGGAAGEHARDSETRQQLGQSKAHRAPHSQTRCTRRHGGGCDGMLSSSEPAASILPPW